MTLNTPTFPHSALKLCLVASKVDMRALGYDEGVIVVVGITSWHQNKNNAQNFKSVWNGEM